MDIDYIFDNLPKKKLKEKVIDKLQAAEILFQDNKKSSSVK